MKKIIIIILVLVTAKITFANELVRFSMENQRVFGDTYLVDVMAEPLAGSWFVGNCNITVKFNEKALSVAEFENDVLMNNDLLIAEDGYKVDQTEFYNNHVTLNIFNITPKTWMNDKQIIGTLRFKILNSAEYDDFEFYPEESEVFNEWQQLEYENKTIEGYTFQNPEAKRLDNLTSIYDSEMSSGVLQVTPNPANDKTNAEINLEVSGNYSLSLYNANGKKLYDIFTNEHITIKSIEINTTDLSTGMYILMLSNGSKSYYNKLIVNH